MAKYNKKFSFDEKYQSIENLIDFYSNTKESNYKAVRLPNWLDFYGKTLLTEKNTKYYSKFSQGTVVFVDYGVPVGGEMSGVHFAIVLSKKDTQYNKTILVVPLSSHSGRNRVYLGKDVLHKAQLSMDKEKDEIEQEVSELKCKIKNLGYDFKSFIKDNNITSLEKFNKLIDSSKIISRFKNYSHQLQLIQNKLNEEQKRLDEFKQELNRLDNYNNDSYACLESISSVSKLKIKKFSKYGIHSNISINPRNLNLIKQKIKDFIDID